MNAPRLVPLDGSVWIALESVTGEPCHVARTRDEVVAWAVRPERHPWEYNVLGPYRLSTDASGLWIVFEVESVEVLHAATSRDAATKWIAERYPFSGRDFRVTGPWCISEPS